MDYAGCSDYFCGWPSDAIGKYQSDGEYYQISGLNLLTGTDVMAGTVHIGVSWVMWIAAVASVVLIVDSVIFKKLKPRIAGVIALVSAFVQLIMGLLLLVTMTSILADTRRAGVEYGLYIYMAISIALIVLSGACLFQNKALSVLDFMVLPGLGYVIINNYLPMIGLSLALRILILRMVYGTAVDRVG